MLNPSDRTDENQQADGFYSAYKKMRIIFFILFLFTFQYSYSQYEKLTITITNIKKIKGNINIGIYNNKEDFPKEQREYKKIIIGVNAPVMTYTLEIPQGEYAVALFHDENSDGKCNRNLLWIPIEEYGFSNNIRPKLFAPSFEAVKFKVERTKSITIALK